MLLGLSPLRNRVAGPPVTFALAPLFLPDKPDLMVAVILIGMVNVALAFRRRYPLSAA